jgi:amino acid adenylation domain-containing protein/thioester reductase-like protein
MSISLLAHRQAHAAASLGAASAFDPQASTGLASHDADCPTSVEPNACTHALQTQLDPSLVAQLYSFAQNQHTSLSLVLPAAFAALLARCTGQEIVRVGPVLAADRAAPAAELNFDGEPTCADVIVQLERALGAAGTSAAAAPGAHSGIALTYHYQREDCSASCGYGRRSGDGELRLTIVDSAGNLWSSWGFQAGRVEPSALDRLHLHFQTLLAGLAANPRMPLLRLPLLAPDERQQQAEWNATAAAYPDRHCAHWLFESWARRQPDAPALTFENETISYRELDARANQLAHYLRRLGVGPDVLVGIGVERSPAMIVGVLGVLKAGGAYLPLDPTYPADRLAFMLADAQVSVLLTTCMVDADQWLPEQASAGAPAIVFLDADWPRIAREPEFAPASEVTADNLAYVIYTSGSTGRPKGTLLEHRGLCNLAEAQRLTLGAGPGQRVLQFASCSFDASVWEWAMALCNGATLCLAPQERLASGPDLMRLLREQAITIATLPPSLLAVQPADGLPALTTLITAGEACTADLVARWAPGRRLFNAYGPTESTVCASWHLCDPADRHAPPIGRPLPNMQLYILDRAGQPVPAGVPGELHIAGFSLARGYLNRPELTAERFIASDLVPGLRLYKTGDLARYRADGAIEFLGRVDHQVKLRGFRIELGEIEATLIQHPRVHNAVVLAREDVPGLQQLVAYVVADADDAAAAELQAELRIFLRRTLPAYMLPSAILVLSALPLTSNGKVDRRALPAPLPGRAELDGAAAPRTPAEALIAEIWAAALGRPQIGIDDDFFALGGHSLLAARAIVQVNAALDRDIPLRAIYEAPTVAAFADMIAGDTVLHAAAHPRDDIALDPAIAPADVPLIDTAPRAILLTGATGFLGAFLLAELLMQTSAAIYCLVRAADARSGEQRIRQALNEYQLWRDAWHHRIVPVLGDLGQPRLGLGQPAFDQLAATIDVIYHAGAQVHYLYPYSALRAINVQGTVEIVRLACQQRPKPLHYISTIAVAGITPDGRLAHASDDLATDANPVGYAQSKWVSENILQIARGRGLPVAIYRPGRIGSHTRTGGANPDDFLVRLLAGCIQLGLAPDIPLVENLIPVDYTAQAIAHLAQRGAQANATFHLLNPRSTPWQTIVAAAQRRGYRLILVPYHEWHRVLMQRAAADRSNLLHSLSMLMPRNATTTSWIDAWMEQGFDTRDVTAGLEGSGIACPPIDDAQLEHMLIDGVRRGLFAAAPRAAATSPTALTTLADR